MERKGRKQYRVRLSAEERAELSGIVNGKAAAYRRKHAHILLLADEDRWGTHRRGYCVGYGGWRLHRGTGAQALRGGGP